MTKPTPGSSSPAPRRLVTEAALDKPLAAYASDMVHGHQQILAAILGHQEKDERERDQIAALTSPGPV
jgi:hypothetical protein